MSADTVLFDAVLFDLDGTLVDTEGLWWDSARLVATDLGRELTGDDLPFVSGRSIDDTAAYLAPGDSAAVAVRLTREFRARVAAGVRPLPGALELLADLSSHGIPTALVTASPWEVVEQVLPLLGGHRFGTVVADGDTARGKPDPAPYLEAARRLGVVPRRCVAVEDSPTGIAAARAAGCRVFPVSPSGLPAFAVLSGQA